MEPTQTTEQPAHAKSSTGAIIVLILIVALIVAGAFYTWQNRASAPSLQQEAVVESFEAQGDSTEPDAIEADLEAQSSEEFDAELEKAFTELDASFEE